MNAQANKLITLFQDSFSEDVWRTTYKDHTDGSVDSTFWRVATAAASVEETDEKRIEWAEKFFDLFSNFKTLAGGRIIANAGTEFKGTTLMNCFVGPQPKTDVDSLEGIMKMLSDQCKTLKSEGGWGNNFSVLRPRGSFIEGIGVETPGAVKYMELFDKSSEIITSGSGTESTNIKAKGKIRKGAQMSVLDIWHPDIIEFITAKQTEGKLSKFNMSVNCTDEFMNKVILVKDLREKKASKEEIAAIQWDLVFPVTAHKKYKTEWNGDIATWKAKGYEIKVYRTVSVDWLWNLITESTYKRNEPGVLFLDRANYFNPLNYLEKIMATNPCVTGDTRVATADGRNMVSIKQLADEGRDVPVYCLDKNGHVTIRQMRNPRVTGQREPVYKILLDDGSSVRATANHKFRLKTGDYKEVSSLCPGDSLDLLTKYVANFEEIFKGANSKSHNYMWVNHRSRNRGEHRYIAEFYNNTLLTPGQVVHHKDYCGLNNLPENLQIMEKHEHDVFHGKDMLGDRNPMRRAQTEWSAEKWADYRMKQSKANAGIANSNYSGVTNDELREHALMLTRELRRRFSNNDWRIYSEAHGLPQQFSKWRNNHLNGMLGLAKWAAIQCELDSVNLNSRRGRKFLEYLRDGYDCKLVGEEIIFTKTCEVCDAEYETARREQGICSRQCQQEKINADPEIRKRQKESFQSAIAIRHKELKSKQIQVFNNLKASLGRIPLKKEWAVSCKNLQISAEACRKSSPFTTFDALIEAASNFNHRIVTITLDGYDTVYNGTVDEFHNFFIGGFESKTKSDKNKYQFINNLQCGEQTLAPGGVCCLGTLNLTQFVNKARTGFDLSKIGKYVKYLVRFLDNIKTLSSAPLPEYEFSMRNKRRIGCGIMGWGSALYMLKTRLGSPVANKMRDDLMRAFTHAAVAESIDLAKEKGKFSLCDPQKHSLSPFWDNIELPQAMRDDIARFGIRNSSLFSCQPNGNSSIFANIVSGGIEPVFLPEYTRTVIVSSAPDHIADVTPKWYQGEFFETKMFKFTKEGDEQILKGRDNQGVIYKIDKNRGLTKEVLCQDYGVRYLTALGEWNAKADWAVTTETLSVAEHTGDLQGFARWLDSACSKTVNLPNKYDFKDFQNIYLDAYKTNVIKGLTTYRAGTMTTVLSANDDDEIIKDDVKLPDSCPSVMKTLRAENRKWYLTVVLNNENPVALFVHTNSLEKGVTTSDAVEKLIKLAYNKKIPKKHIVDVEEKMTSDSNSTKLARCISLLLRHGVKIKNVVTELDKVQAATVGSFLFQIKKFLQSYIRDGEKIEGQTCAACGSSNMEYSQGCQICKDCGSGRCS